MALQTQVRQQQTVAPDEPGADEAWMAKSYTENNHGRQALEDNISLLQTQLSTAEFLTE